MKNRVSVDLMDELRREVEAVISLSRFAPFLTYADIRVEIGEGQGAAAENGEAKASGKDYGFSFGIRVIAGVNIQAAGYFGQTLGAADLDKFQDRLREGFFHAYERAMANSRRKWEAIKHFPAFADSFLDLRLQPMEVNVDRVPARFKINPLSMPIGEVVKAATDVSKMIAGLSPEIRYNYSAASTGLRRQLFMSTEGADIDQTFAVTAGFCYVAAGSSRGYSSLYDYMGHQAGWEFIEEGADEEFIKFPNFSDFGRGLAEKCVKLSHAKPLRRTDDEVVVVTDPHFNTLLVHEILGHPTEADRALKMETAYAGRTWLMRGPEDNQIGRQIASPLVNAYSDPNLPGLGHYKYDDEGTRAKRIIHIENGIFRGFMNSRQTAFLMNAEPNGHYVAIDAMFVPLIRMSNTVFAQGDKDPQDIIKEIDHGYYLVGMRTPSISESRENFRITSMLTYEIRNGEVGELFRDGGIMADSKDFLMKVDAVGNDFRIIPVGNCGKGQPMQARRLGNGGSTMRSRARLTGI